jgi:hypothetical protein
MVGGYAVRYALEHPAVVRVTAIGRRKLGISHPKLKEVLHRDFADCSALAERFSGQGAAVYCISAYTEAVPDAVLRKITVDYKPPWGRCATLSIRAEYQLEYGALVRRSTGGSGAVEIAIASLEQSACRYRTIMGSATEGIQHCCDSCRSDLIDCSAATITAIDIGGRAVGIRTRTAGRASARCGSPVEVAVTGLHQRSRRPLAIRRTAAEGIQHRFGA